MDDSGQGAASAFEAKARATKTEERSLVKLAIARSKGLSAASSEDEVRYQDEKL